MVSLGICLLSSISKLIPKPQRCYSHVLNIPFPKVLHQRLDSTYLEQFEEIFIIGDVHGCFDELKMLLEKAEALDNKVLKIFVGDLVNKGPKNKQVLALLQSSSSMLSVRGNHDEAVLHEYYNSQKSDYKLKDKNMWIKDLTPENVNYLLELPYTISIPSLNSIVVHAGIVPGVPLEINDPFDLVEMRNVVSTDYFWDGGLLATKDDTKGEPWASMWGGPEHVYFGHDAKRMLQNEVLATGLDTGCVYGNQLTGLFIYGSRKGKFVQVSALEEYTQVQSKKRAK